MTFCAFCAALDSQCFAINETTTCIAALEAKTKAEIQAKAKIQAAAEAEQITSLFNF